MQSAGGDGARDLPDHPRAAPTYVNTKGVNPAPGQHGRNPGDGSGARRHIGSNTGFIFASQTAGSVLRVVYAAVLARKLGPELFGLMSYGLGWYAAFLAVANLQLESYMSRRVALAPARAGEVLSATLTLRTFSTALVFALATFAALRMNSGADTLLAQVLLIFAFAMAGRSAAMWCSSAFIASEDAAQAFRLEVLFRTGEVLAGIAALLAGFGLVAVALIHALAWWCQAFYGYLLVRRHVAQARFRPRLSEQLSLLRAVLPVALASIGATWLMQGPFVMFRDRAHDAGDVGLVALVLQIFVLVVGIPSALGRAALPALSRTVVRTDRKEAIFFSLVARAAIPGTAAFAIASLAAGTGIVTLVFGEDYRGAGEHLVYGMLLVLPFGIATIANQILIAHDRGWQAMAAAVVGALAMTLFVVTLVSHGASMTGYFLCVLGGMAVWVVLTLAWLARCVAIPWWQCVTKPALASAVAFAAYAGLEASVGRWTGLGVALVLLLVTQRLFNIVSAQELAAMSRGLFARIGRGPMTD